MAETPYFTLPFHLVDGLILIDGQVEGIPGKFMFDTGDHGTLELTPTLKAALEQAGYLTLEPADYLYGAYEPYTRCRLTGLRSGDQRLADLYNLRLVVGDHNRLILGYQFLKNYVTAWNYKAQTITLLRR